MECTIPIRPQAKQSARVVSKGGKTWSFQPKKKVDYVNDLKTVLLAHKKTPLINTACKLEVTYYFKQITNGGWRTGTPDIDNILKPLKDALTGIIIIDDSIICWIDAKKRNSRVDGIELKLYDLEGKE